jgi:4-amino-4-deoxy-L-arabinose transferase-like glycosyltransferase
MHAAVEAQPITTATRRRVAWDVVALIGVLSLAALVYIWNLTVSGYANTYYSMAAQAASLDWSAWFWGSLDPSNFVTVDKPPLATMVMGLSVRLFGLSSWSILLPQAICGVATVGVLWAIVRRTSGSVVAALVAALVLALTPAAVLMFRYNNPDALLTLLLVLAAWALLRAISTGGLRWVVLAALLVGLAFNTKFLQAYLVLPAFALTYLVAAPGRLRRRVVGLATALVVTIASSAWWVAVVELVPAGSRPFIGGSTDGSALQLLFGYDGLGRIFGFGGFGGAPATGPTGIDGNAGGAALNAGPGGGFGFGGSPGLLRMLNTRFGGQIAWFLPFAFIGGVASLAVARRKPRTDLARAATLVWLTWLVTHVLVFSLMGGIIHTYYVVVIAPAIGALVGTAIVDLYRARTAHRTIAGLSLAAAVAVSTLVAVDLLLRTPEFVPWLTPLVAILGFGSAAAVALWAIVPRDLSNRQIARHAMGAAAALGFVAVLAGPAAYATSTIATAYSGGDPSAGPEVTRTSLIGDVLGTSGTDDGTVAAGPGAGPFGGDGGPRPPNDGAPGDGQQPIGFPSGPPPGGVPNNGFGGFAERDPGGLTEAELAYLVANRGDTRWIVAAGAANEAAPIQLATGQPVMAMGGFNGSDPAPTLDELRAYIASGELRFVVALEDGFDGFRVGPGVDTGISGWVRANCTAVVIDGVKSSTLYDCAGAS